jgi:hypothetical protein
MENIQADLPFVAENLNGIKLVPEISISWLLTVIL